MAGEINHGFEERRPLKPMDYNTLLVFQLNRIQEAAAEGNASGYVRLVDGLESLLADKLEEEGYKKELGALDLEKKTKVDKIDKEARPNDVVLPDEKIRKVTYEFAASKFRALVGLMAREGLCGETKTSLQSYDEQLSG